MPRADTVRRALELVDIACVQNAYSVVNRAEEDVLALCEEREIAFVPFFPLGSAFAGGPQAARGRPGDRGGRRATRGATPSQIALAWLLHRSERILLIPGTSSVGHLEENIAAGDIELDEQDMRHSRTPPSSATRWPPPSTSVEPRQSVASAARVAASAGA